MAALKNRSFQSESENIGQSKFLVFLKKKTLKLQCIVFCFNLWQQIELVVKMQKKTKDKLLVKNNKFL